MNLLLVNEIEDILPKNIFCELHVLGRKLARVFGHPTQVSRQVQLASTCDYLPIRLANTFNFSDKTFSLSSSLEPLEILRV